MLLICKQNSFGQKKSIYLINKINGKEFVVNEGTKIRIYNNAKNLKGKFSIINDSLILINNDSCKVSNIVSLEKQQLGSQMIGEFVIIFFSVPIIGGLAIILTTAITQGFMGDAGMVLLLVPVIFFSAIGELAGIMTYQLMKKYDNSKWDIKIKEQKLKDEYIRQR